MSNISEEIDVIEQFNRIYIEVVKSLQRMCNVKKYKGMKKLTKVRIDMTFDAYLRVVKEDSQFALTEFGPLIFAEREKIVAGDDKHFLNKNYNLFMFKIANKYNFEYQYSLDLIELTKEVYSNASEDAKVEVRGKVQNLLAYYSQYAFIKMEQSEKN
jgi:hypothetical protein